MLPPGWSSTSVSLDASRTLVTYRRRDLRVRLFVTDLGVEVMIIPSLTQPILRTSDDLEEMTRILRVAYRQCEDLRKPKRPAKSKPRRLEPARKGAA